MRELLRTVEALQVALNEFREELACWVAVSERENAQRLRDAKQTVSVFISSDSVCRSIKPGTSHGDYASPVHCVLTKGHTGDHEAVGTEWKNRRKK